MTSHSLKYSYNQLRDKTVVDIFEQIALHNQNNIAVIQGNMAITYKELNARANDLARILINNGASHDHYIGICSKRSIEMIIGLLAILKVGAAYVPLNFDLPLPYLNNMISDASLRFCLVNSEASQTPRELKLEYIDLSYTSEQLQTENIHVAKSCQSAAYVNFSSGTTGKPKGIICTHRGIIRLLFSQNYLSLSPTTTTLQVAPISFDAATFEIWAALLHGGKCILSTEAVISCAGIKQAIKHHRVNTLFLTTALFNALVDNDPSCFAGLKTLLFGGDIASIKHIKKLYCHNEEIELINCYGPTENTTFTTYYPIPRKIIDANDLSVPIGGPIAHTNVHILNNANQPVAPGILGELCISGDGLAQGYLNDTNLTASSFIDYCNAGIIIKIYKTGDLAYYREDGLINFVGRRDLQTKINGFRINIGELENTINTFNTVKTCAIVPHITATKEKVLMAFVVGNPNDEDDLKAYLKNNIPYYSLPKKIMWLSSLPITKNGKIDKHKLQEQLSDYARSPENLGNINAISESDRKLYDILTDILGTTEINSSDDFFSLGGTSLGMIRLAASLETSFKVSLNSTEFYKNPTITYLKSIIDAASNNNETIEINSTDQLIFSMAKNQARFFQQYRINPSSTNMNIIFHVDVEPIDHEKFMASLQSTLNSMRIFNCKITSDLKVHFSTNFEYHSSIDRCHQFNTSALNEVISEESKYYFNLHEQTPLRIRAYNVGNKITLIFNIHHLFFDGSSMFKLKTMVNDLANDNPIHCPKLDYIDFCLENSSNSNNAPDDSVLKRYWDYIGESKLFCISSITNKREACEAEGYQLSINKNDFLIDNSTKSVGIDKLLLAFQMTIHSTYGMDELICQMPIASNQIGDYKNSLGYFIDILIYQNHLNMEDSIENQLVAVNQSFRTAQSFLEINPIDLADQHERFDFSSVLFNYIPTDEILDITEKYYSYDKKFYRELLIFIYENNDYIHFKFVFNKKIFTPTLMKDFTHLFKNKITELFLDLQQ